MAELPGWDRRRLRSADPADVDAARWIAFSRALAPTATRDLDSLLEQLRLADLDPKARERAEKSARSKDREGVRTLMAQQREVRKMLLLDEPDEDSADG